MRSGLVWFAVVTGLLLVPAAMVCAYGGQEPTSACPDQNEFRIANMSITYSCAGLLAAALKKQPELKAKGATKVVLEVPKEKQDTTVPPVVNKWFEVFGYVRAEAYDKDNKAVGEVTIFSPALELSVMIPDDLHKWYLETRNNQNPKVYFSVGKTAWLPAEALLNSSGFQVTVSNPKGELKQGYWYYTVKITAWPGGDPVIAFGD